MGNLSSLSHIFIDSIIYLDHYRLMVIYFIILCAINTTKFILLLNFFFFLLFSIESSFSWLLYHFGISYYGGYYFLSPIIPSGTRLYSRLILYISFPRSNINCFFKEAWFLLLKMILETKIWVLGVCAQCW